MSATHAETDTQRLFHIIKLSRFAATHAKNRAEALSIRTKYIHVQQHQDHNFKKATVPSVTIYPGIKAQRERLPFKTTCNLTMFDRSSKSGNGGARSGSRIPASLQAVFLASNRGKDVEKLKPPPEQAAYKVFFRNWRFQRQSGSKKNSLKESATPCALDVKPDKPVAPLPKVCKEESAQLKSDNLSNSNIFSRPPLVSFSPDCRHNPSPSGILGRHDPLPWIFHFSFYLLADCVL